MTSNGGPVDRKSLETLFVRSRVPLAFWKARLMANEALGRATVGRHPQRERVDGQPLQILVHVPTYPPATHSGSEMSLHTALRYLQSHGHHIRVLVPTDQEESIEDGIPVRYEAPGRTDDAYEWADIVFTQLHLHNQVARLAARHQRPFVRFMRMGGGLNRARNCGRPQLLVFNAQWLKDRYPYPTPTIVLHSPIDFTRYQATVTGDQITQINLSERKGGKVFYEVARRMPERKFVGVIGSWGAQETSAAALPNVEIVEHTDDILSVYAQTRILMFPSLYEPHPRTPLEACASGIPTIANPVPGTVEALGDAGIYHDADDPEAWVAEIRRLDDPEIYREASQAALRRVAEKDPLPELEAFEQAVLDTVTRYRASRR